MEYKILARLFDRLSQTTLRLEKIAILVEFLKKLKKEDAKEALYLLQGRVFPIGDPRRVGLAAKMVLKALSVASGYSTSEIEAKVKEHGDVGEVVASLVGSKRQQTLFSEDLSVHEVFTTLQKIASIEGTSAMDQKSGLLNKLLTSADGIEAKFIVRTVLEDLRVGIAEGTLRDAVSYAYFTTTFSYNKEKNSITHEMKQDVGSLEEVKVKVKRAIDLSLDYVVVVEHLLAGQSINNITLEVGRPLHVMLCRKEKTFADAFARTGTPVRLEYKYDGFRLQIHKKGNDISLYTRSLENVTKQFPEVVAIIKTNIKATNCILDGEALGYDAQTKQFKPFQHISQRIRRKYDIEELATQLPVEAHIFDILKLEDEDVLDRPQQERLALLQDIVVVKEHHIQLVRGVEVHNEEEAQAFYQESLSAGNEGIVIKDIKAPYEPGGRVSAWIKMKPTMDELDLVVVGAEWGTGKRSAWMTSFTLACQNEAGEFVTIGKVGTGLKELESEGLSFGQITALLEPLIIKREGQHVDVQPHVVLEIAYEEIQKSPSYESGYALRFPRVIRNRTEERTPDSIATLDEVIDLFESQ